MSNKQNLQENQAAEVIATTGAWVETNKKSIISIVTNVMTLRYTPTSIYTPSRNSTTA